MHKFVGVLNKYIIFLRDSWKGEIGERAKIATREEKREAEEKKMRLFFGGGGRGHYSQSNVESFYYERKLPTTDKNKQCVGFQTKKVLVWNTDVFGAGAYYFPLRSNRLPVVSIQVNSVEV